ncbi:hypothetical protein [Paraburkholderia sp. MM6662-R1]|uniref:hypothetical protein n=1 Tax=Paraburkholderia sp. MM6662-R1 TaxID=2991066 RepID=UPI003D22641A
MELVADGGVQPVPRLPERDGGVRLAVQQTSRPHEVVRNAARAVHGAELLVQHASEGKQIVTLVPQGNARRTDARWILRFAPMKFLDDEVDISYRFCGGAHEIHRWPIHFPKLFTSQSSVKANERKGNGTLAFSGYLSR